MNTIAANQKIIVEREKRSSLKEAVKKYFSENASIIIAGLLMSNGSASPYSVYRSLR